MKRNSNNTKSPLDGRIGAHFGGRISTRRTRIVLGLFVVIATPMFASTLAASVTLNNGDAVEFGQGEGLVIACGWRKGTMADHRAISRNFGPPFARKDG